ncbi:MAG: hypothetical protein K6C99_05805 [Lachnospiraceae bacterium]|nr:hypothetical protein [Lachnospiraceae bacterium]
MAELMRLPEKILIIMVGAFIIILSLSAPVILSIGNICGLIFSGMKLKRLCWGLTVPLGLFLSLIFLGVLEDVTDKPWNEQLINSQVHEILNSQTVGIYVVLMLIGAAGFLILAVRKMENTPPLVSVLSIAAMYPAAISCVVWCVHIFPTDKGDKLTFPLMVLPVNLIIMMCALIREKIIEWNAVGEEQDLPGGTGLSGSKWHRGFLGKAERWPLMALLFMLPLLGVILGISVLIGQRPDALIATWTETADWNLSQMIPPPNVEVDEHYLCTVAAGGHEKVVKPLRMGERHGHRVVVNRQLEIANAFELVLEWKIPRLHRVIRNFYDKYGFPIARCIRTKTACDIVYFIMKPLEWFFVIVLYLTLAHPENIIAVQYLPGYRDVLERSKNSVV